MATRITVTHNGVSLEPYWYDPAAKGLKADRYGKLGGYRVHPPGSGHNESDKGIFYKSLEDVAQHIRANRDWGLRFASSNGKPNIFYDGIIIDDMPR